MAIEQSGVPPVSTAGEASDGGPSRGSWVRDHLSFRQISAVYIFVVLFAIFAVWVPDTFVNWDTWKALLDDQAITAVVAIGLVIALSAGSFNLAVGAQVGIGSMFAAWLLAKHGLSVPTTIVLTVISGGVIGIVSGLLITGARIDSFIATLGVSSILLALISWLSNGQQILELGSSYQSISTHEIFGITNPVYIMLAVALVVWYFLERTPAGRKVYATGGNKDAARLAGVPTARVIVLAMMSCGLVCALAGILVSSRVATGDPTVGPSYLLPAFAAAFLGSTQFRGGRYNVWGTVVAVYVLATGVKGLQLAGAPVWIPELFDGVALLLAVGLAKFEALPGGGKAIRRVLRFERAPA